MERRNAWLSYTEAEERELENVVSGYRYFLDHGKTERECVKEIVKEAQAAGYVSLEEKIAKGEQVKAGDKVYAVWMKKIVALFHIGKENLENGMNIVGSHIDSPRLDVKQNPLYEDTDIAYLDTHYYGGVKKYQWVALPLAIHGVVAKKDGSVIDVVIGEDESDPVVYISDLLIHLSQKQIQKTAAEVITGEALDVMIGNRPLKDLPDEEKKNAVKQNILKILNEKYGMDEEDFLSAELEVVPAGKSRECGLDRSMITAYGQDDRVCAYTCLHALLEMETPNKTACALFVDKEEIGSMGATGMQSSFLEDATAELLDAMGCYSEKNVRRALRNSRVLSSDVAAAFDPLHSEVYEKKNSAYMGRGIAIAKYTGRGGKASSNDANAEYVAAIRSIFDKHHVAFQTAEIGHVDAGGGGTIAYMVARYGMEVVDSGVAVLSMHAPWEVISKADVYEAKKAYKAFYIEA